MKILYIGPSVYTSKGILINDEFLVNKEEILRKNFYNSSCFGYEAILINPVSISVLLNRSGVEGGLEYPIILGFANKMKQWARELQEWLEKGGKLFVIIQPVKIAWGKSFDDSFETIQNYGFLPTNISLNIQESSAESYLGDIVSTQPQLKQYLEGDTFFVRAYLNKSDRFRVDPLSQFNENRITSFRITYGSGEAIFVPDPKNILSIFEFIKREQDTIPWTVNEQELLIKSLAKTQKRLSVFVEKKAKLEKELILLRTNIIDLAQKDIFFTKAIKKYKTLATTKNPDPRDIYDVFETIENAFPSEKEMRKSLGLTREKCGKITRRCNEFRHDQKGPEPKPLSEKETEEFMSMISNIINKYLQFIFDK